MATKEQLYSALQRADAAGDVEAAKAIASMLSTMPDVSTLGSGQEGGYPQLDTKLSPEQESSFQEWKKTYAPNDSGFDYDFRGAYLDGLRPDPATAHWPDTYKKPNHPTFSNESKFAKDYSDKAGSWNGDTYIPPSTMQNQPQEPDLITRIAQTLRERGGQYKDIVAARDAGKQTDLESALQIVGKPIAGTVNDAIGGAIGLAGKGLSALTPDFIEDPLVNAAGSVFGAGAETASPALSRISEMYGNFAKESPRAARNLEAIANIGMVAPVAQPLAVGGKAAVQATGQAAKAAGRATRNTVAPTISADVLPLAQRAEEFGIPLRLDQVAPSRFRNTVQKVSQEIPFSGVNSFEDTQRAAWNKRLAQEVGGEGFEDLSPASVKKIVDRNSKEFDSLLKDKTINVDNVFIEEIGRYANELGKTTSDEISKVVMRNIDELKDDIAEGAITGERLASIRTKLINRQGKGEVSDKLGEVIGYIDDLAERNLSPEEAARLAGVRKKYKYLKTVEPLLEKAATDGGINPTQLLNRIAANPYIKASRLETGDDVLVDLARIGKEFLPTKGGSDTAQKAYLSGALGTGSVAGALTNLPLTAATLAGNRALQSLYNSSQPMIRAAISKSVRKSAKGQK